ncbi:MAG TPA: hypothetical protein VJ770_04520 [Stellaceae bacterium]|nr:hypothetical protein [Stellaceae bacterium]
MTLGEAELIFESWLETPPTHHMAQVLARLWGWKPRTRSRAETGPSRTLPAIPGLDHRPVGEGLPAVILDFAALRRSGMRIDKTVAKVGADIEEKPRGE